MKTSNQELLRNLPSVDSFLNEKQLLDIVGIDCESGGQAGSGIIIKAVRGAIGVVRKQLIGGDIVDVSLENLRGVIVDQVAVSLKETMKPFYCKVVNASGIILHTALGRAVLSERAIDQIVKELSGYSLLQMDMETGKRSQRDVRIAELLRELTGAESATVVNNNAAATAIVLNTIGAGKEVIVSRGQLVEIGGSFRLPDVMATSGVKMVEVGTTNKTHLRDYANAITEETAAILRVHPSNYQITGFTSEVPLKEMADLAHENGLVMFDDVGAGALIDFSRFGFDYEPTLMDSIRDGADIVSCSADKLIGASQGGVILGKAEIVKAVRKNPWARILRVDKLTLAALEATLRLFLDEKLALKEVPTLAMLQRKLPELVKMARGIIEELDKLNCDADIIAIDGNSQMGSGSLPSQNLPSRLIAVRPNKMSVNELSRRLRLNSTPIIARIQDGQLLLDPRTMREGEDEIVVTALGEILARG